MMGLGYPWWGYVGVCEGKLEEVKEDKSKEG